MTMTLSELFFWFVFYSFTGWVYESALCSILSKKPVNRGFLNGPVCPIYGCGALLVILVFHNTTQSILSLFLASSVLTCTLEYVVSYCMERLFHARWWDYSDKKFNLNGRVCLEGAIVFGLFSVLLIRFIHPGLMTFIYAHLPNRAITVISLALFIGLAIDTYFSVRHIVQLNGRLAEIQKAYNEYKATLLLNLHKNKEGISTKLLVKFENSEFCNERIRKLLDLRKFQDLRLTRAFPKFKSMKHKEAWESLQAKLFEHRNK